MSVAHPKPASLLPSPTPTFTFVDLFAGIGGFRLGLQALGGHCLFSSEIDRFAQETYAANFGAKPHGDIRCIEAAAIPDHDVLAAGFPCQAFSIAGRRGGFADTRGTLFFEVARILDAKRPPAFILENVRGLVHHQRGRTLQTILHTLRYDLGYCVPEPALLNARHFGLPQNRERIFIIGFREAAAAKRYGLPRGGGEAAVFGQIKEKTAVPAKYYLSARYLQTLRNHRQRHESKGNGFGYEVIGDDAAANAIVVGGMGRERNLVIDDRLVSHEPQTRLQGEINREGIRRMTPREWARLQGFPDTFVFPVSDTQAYKQLANAVAVPVVTAVAAALLHALDLPR